jgi:flagellar hook assembly protein FlgD
MRRTAVRQLVAPLAALLLAASFVAPAAAVGPDTTRSTSASGAKVVIVVGPTGGATDSYVEDAQAAAAAARRWTDEVVELYTPDATWDAVSTAMQGASIVVFMGHGNGFPSPHANAMDPDTQNGLGLNPPGGGRLTPTSYYGEGLIAEQVRLAPSAVVILAHLCYAAGSSEAGYADPTPEVARQRADNFAAGFLAAGARAVIADAWFGAAGYYIDGLFSSQTTVEDLFRTAPSSNGADDVAPSVRSAGANVDLDPHDGTFWRALSAFPALLAGDVVGGRVSDTSADPASLQVPGAAEAGPAGAQLYAGASALAGTLAPGTRLRVVRSVTQAADGPLAGVKAVEVRSLDGSLAGLVAADSLIPRDSRAPLAYQIQGSGGGLSPNGDGINDLYSISGSLSEQAMWTATISSEAGAQVYATGGGGDAFAVTWDGTGGGVAAPTGRYVLVVQASDGWQNTGVAFRSTIALDVTVPTLTATSPSTATVISPNGDKVADTLRTAFTASEAATLEVTVRDAAGTVVDSSEVHVGSGAGAVIWDGRGASGAVLPDGTYAYQLVARDAAGNGSSPLVRSVIISTTLTGVRSTRLVFDPASAGATIRDTAIAFMLARPAAVTVTISDAKGKTVRTVARSLQMGAGAQQVTWDGLTDAGTPVADGLYYPIVRVGDGNTSAAQRTTVGVGAMRIVVSPGTLGRGKAATITVAVSSPLAKAPKIMVGQPGIAPWAAKAAKIDATTWRVKVRIKSGGAAGTTTVTATGTGADGAAIGSSIRLPTR